jgi:PelA/Pel-15E family pectate lyase
MTMMLTQSEREELVKTKADFSETTIDNRTTYTQIAFLAKAITGSLQKTTPPTNFPKHKDAFFKGLDYLLASQYENGGFPQFYPLKKGYYTHITFNDDAMIGALSVLRSIARKEEDYKFVDEDRRAKCEKAVAKALPVILKTQVAVAGKKTVWVQQYDEKTLEPAPARKFEPIALTAGESVAIVRYLMDIETPDAAVVEAVEAAVAWFQANQLKGIRWERVGGDSVVVKDNNAPPLWARFYDIKTMKPIFIGRDSVIHYDVKEIEAERRNGYAWYVGGPNELLAKDYPKWKARLAKKN